MGIDSKEEQVLEIFLNEPAKQWHFTKIVDTAKVSEPIANKWLNKLLKEDIIQKVKKKGKMPYFIGNFRHDNYRNKKKIYAIQKLYESGLLTRLQSLKHAKTIVIFGSFARSDWNTQSDVDIFILGDAEDFQYGAFWKGLGFQGKSREIQIHTFHTRKEIREVRSGLMKNVVQGFFLKGNIHDIAEVST